MTECTNKMTDKLISYFINLWRNKWISTQFRIEEKECMWKFCAFSGHKSSVCICWWWQKFHRSQMMVSKWPICSHLTKRIIEQQPSMAWSWANLQRQRREIGLLHEGNDGEFGFTMPCLVTLGLGEKHQSRCKRELDSCLLWCVSREPEEVAIMLNCIFQAIVWPATLLMLLLLLAVIVTLLHESLPSPRRPSNMSATAETTQRHATCQAFGLLLSTAKRDVVCRSQSTPTLQINLCCCDEEF
jgi:hypothetical protein